MREYVRILHKAEDDCKKMLGMMSLIYLRYVFQNISEMSRIILLAQDAPSASESLTTRFFANHWFILTQDFKDELKKSAEEMAAKHYGTVPRSLTWMTAKESSNSLFAPEIINNIIDSAKLFKVHP